MHFETIIEVALMAIYAIGDLHLSSTSNKPMDVFGPQWAGHAKKISKNWDFLVGDNDLVVVPGDISWAQRLEAAIPDLEWLAARKGTKLIIKGNHDYWWPTIGRLREKLPASIYALQNDHFVWNTRAVCGTRGWICPGEEGFDNDQDQKLYLREVQRLRLSLDSAKTNSFGSIIAALHFPPFNRRGQASAFTEVLEEYGVKICIYGHVHDGGKEAFFQGEKNGVHYRFVAADGINFSPLLIAR
ncbi:MAG: metallophosphoesterase [Bacillota bacterium]